MSRSPRRGGNKVTVENVRQLLPQTCYSKLNQAHQAYIAGDVKAFLKRNPACVCQIVTAKFGDGSSGSVY